VPLAYYQAQPPDVPYRPAAFAEEGFIHCTADLEMLLKVANSYYSGLDDDLLVLAIDPAQLSAPLKFEHPIPPALVTISPVAHQGQLFPHIYGPLNRQAVAHTFNLIRDDIGQWNLPDL
jgi:uncharacterized protein (DUF952 family)